MKVVLLEEISSLGKIGDVIKVADGHARNYLIPQGKALEATKKNVKTLELQKKLTRDRVDRTKKYAEKLAERIEDISCTISKQAGEEDKLFGSVTTMDIEEGLKNEGIEVNRRKIMLEEPIKKLGIYSVPIKLHPEVISNLKVWVVKV
ncbi:MAG: 50S ribosomal protein L9 [Thermodesulfobacteriota bacterium]|nr:50S ribosomal protein L9 [Thermodesulfobacteriota bacterium]